MAFINQVETETDKQKKIGGHLNWMGGTSYPIGHPVYNLRLAASSCFFGEPMYYHTDKDDKRPTRSVGAQHALTDAMRDHLRSELDAIDPQDWRGLSPAELMERAIDQALEFDPEATLQEAARLRNEEHIRTTPQVILVRAANNKKLKGTGLVRKYAPAIVKRADEPAVCLAYQIAKFGKPIPNSLKRALADALANTNEYNLAKYRMESRGVKTVDVVNLVHAYSDPINKLVKGELKNTDTWESMISTKGSTKENWEKAIDVMGHMALLRNIRNLLEKGVPQDLFVEKLIAGAKDGKQLPFRYYSAYNAVKDTAPGGVLDAIESCLMNSLDNLPKFSGRVMSLCDNSGSARGNTTSSMGTVQVSTIANLTGVLTGMCADDGYVGVFGDKLTITPIRKKSSVFDQLKVVDKAGEKVGQSTENGIWLFWDQAIRNNEKWDHVFVYSDMQAGHGGLYGTDRNAYKNYIWKHGYDPRYIDVPKLIATYRREVNPNVNVYLVQVAGYQNTIIPEFYKRTYILGGWGDGLLRFAKTMESMQQ